MKRIFKLFVVFLFIFTISANFIKAECNDDDLNEWATTIEPVFVENKYEITHYDSRTAKFSYFLSIAPLREDIKILVIDGSGNKGSAKTYEFSDKKTLYGVGAFTNLEDETYTIEVYGNDNSKCKDELLKRLTYTVPRFNRKSKDARCEDNPDLEICKTFTNSTKNMTDAEFRKELEKYIEEKHPSTTRDIIISILGYSLFVIIPILIVGIYYFRKIRIVKKEQKNR